MENSNENIEDQPIDRIFIETNNYEEDILSPVEEHELKKLLDSAFAKPFYRPPGNIFGAKIFPSSWNDLDMAHCFSEVIELQEWQEPTMESAIDMCLNILKSHIEFYKTKLVINLDGTHDVAYTSDELVCMAEHLRKKISKLKLEKAADPVKRAFTKLKEMFPERGSLFLLNKSKSHVEKYNCTGVDLDLTEVIEDILLSSPRKQQIIKASPV